ncbi:MAG: restriction endonuclease subunit S [Cyanobacteria bacterium P01_A01_bin.137]
MADETTQLLERHFETAFDAPDGLEKLRELILTLAMRGKLVGQDLMDAPAIELIQVNQKLMDEAFESKRKPIPKLSEIQKSLPYGWERCQLADVALVVMGNSPPGKTYNDHGDGVPLINGPVEFSRDPFGSTIKSKYTTAPSRLCQKGDLLVCVRGATTGRTNIAAFDACIGRGVALVRGWSAQNFLNYVLLQVGQQLLEQGKGTTFPSISYADLAGLEIWLPPLPEQRRIVAKIDQLMARCDELEKLRTERDRKRLTVHTAALNRLLTAQTSDTFTDAWRFIAQYFGELYSVKKNVAELRKAILQLAVMGKLVEQDPSDKPANELLKEIETEHYHLIQQGKIKKTERLPEIKDGEIPFTVPATWCWTRLGNLTRLRNGYAFKSSEYTADGIKLIRNINIAHGDIDHKNIAYYPEAEYKNFEDFTLLRGDIVISLDRPLISTGLKIAILKEEDVPSLLVQRVGRINSEILKINPLFIFTWFNSPLFTERIKPGRSNGVPHLSTKEIEKLLFPLPPLPEQHRIVAKVDQLMALCDTLEHHIDQATDKQTALLNAVMAQV